MFKLHFIDDVETKLSKLKIIEKLKELTLEDKFWRISINGKFFCDANFENDAFSLFYLSKGQHNMLLPKIHGKIIENGECCTIKLFYSTTWEHVILLIFWSFFVWISVKHNVLNIVGHLVLYILIICLAKQYCIYVSKKAVNIIKENID